MGSLNLAKWIDCTEVEGPGKRFALWVQGCTLRCPGCCNPQTFELVPKHIVDSKEVVKWIKHAKCLHSIEGVTLLGGEPMLQAKGLSEVAAGCQENGLSVMVFTGYTIESLNKSPMPGVLDLLQVTDLLVDGPYIEAQLEQQRNWAGSANQRFHFLTEHYIPGIEFDSAYSPSIELRVYSDGTILSNGWPIRI